MSVGRVSGSSIIPVLLFILPMTLIPSVSDPETSLIPWWHCARGPSCRLPCCAASRPANLWPCLGCYWCHTAPSSPITFFSPSCSFPLLRLSFSLCSLSWLMMKLPAGTEWTLLFPQFYIRLNGLFLPACRLEMCHRGLPPFHQKLNGHAVEEEEINAAQRANWTKQPRAHRLSIWMMAH